MAFVDGFVSYNRTLGIRGLLSASSNRLFGMPREFSLSPPGISHPVHIRLRTSDFSLYRDLLLGKAYDISLPFEVTTIVDAGANIGLASVFYANKYPRAKIVAIEPEPSNYAMLVKNVAAYPNVFPVNAALWCADCHVQLGLGKNSSPRFEKWSFRVVESGTPVRALTMPTLMREFQLDSIDLLKVDIEGAEKEVFQNCADWMPAVHGVVIELHDHMRPGCKSTVDAACQGFKSARQDDELTLYLRP